MSSPIADRPTHARRWVLVFTVFLAFVTYVHRVCISQAAPEIQSDLGLNKTQMGVVFSAFTLAYGLFEIPAGWLGDKIGAKRVLIGIVTLWSAFTALTGYAWNLASIVVCRFMFGTGQAGCFPNLTKVFTVWLPASERVRAQGIMWLGARWSGAFTPLLVVWTFGFLSWRNTFVLFGAFGLLWVVVFARWFRDNPRHHPAVNDAELAVLDGADENATGHGDVPWMTFLRNRTVWLLWVQYACVSYGWYFYITWLPTYLREERGLTLEESARLSGLPLLFGGVGCIVAGFALPRLESWVGNQRLARRSIAATGMFIAAGMLVLSPQIGDPYVAMVIMGLASFGSDLSMPSSWGACMSVGGKYAGSMSGSMNMMGNLGGVFCPIAVAQILARTNNNWTVTFWISAAFCVVAGVSWFFIDPVTPLDQATHASGDDSHPATS